MRRILATAVLIAAAAALLVAGTGADEGSDYEVRAIFDSGGFMVEGEEVRIAGARVGTVSEIDVTDAEEAAKSDGSPEPGRAVLVLNIESAAFQDFREDASCVVRPQSLLGEKFVECEPTQPRAEGSEPPPPLEQITDGEPGEGQHLLPLERNRKAVDLDLVNNIMEEPYPDRFRLILNDLGAGLAARGEDLEAVVDRANPALRETNEVLAILASQSRALERLARDGDRVLAPLARDRDHISGFIDNAQRAAEATAERRTELEAGLERLPAFLRETTLTMPELQRFADEATPTVSALGDAAPSLERATVALEPFADSATTALSSLGDAVEASEDDVIGSDPILVELRDLARATEPGATSLNKLLRSTRKTHGFEYVARLIYTTVGIANGFDSYGHFLRALLPTNNCVDYEVVLEAGCGGDFTDEPATTLAAQARFASWADDNLERLLKRAEGSHPDERGGRDRGRDHRPRGGRRDSFETAPAVRDARTMLDFLLGPEPGAEGGR
jgi:ABC-type transporter Mla subunit MlaD